ncbi:MAG: hypothetical protein LKG26_05375 [Saccharofermentans sp.]|jgi:hypothetical protein|nr:hypothetical protein [Mageeibacillus sp.]MCI1263972.1 hypothetical protein [Saccharofermentans sp.]MCI1275497.1 hypothetical protein [Saccharofermentans sp.]MCI2044670.1 hypothetical protein [Mageeibacillus sp.]
MKRFTRRQIIITAAVVAALAVMTGGYLYYAKTYGNASKITLYDTASPDYDWQQLAADNNIVSDYLWSKTQSLMVTGASDGVLIPTSYTIAGRLVTQEASESGIYDLSDQAALLSCYVRAGNRSSAARLKNTVNERFATDSGLYLSRIGSDEDITAEEDNLDWLEAYLEYYAVYGTSDDYVAIKALTGKLFDTDGQIVPESLTVAHYVDTMYASVDDSDGNGNGDGGDASLEQIYGALVGEDQNEEVSRNEEDASVSGVKLSNVRLKLIYDLEHNNLLPQGSYDSALATVQGGIANADIPLYAYAYTVTDGSVSYIYTSEEDAAISVSESVATMRNLAEMGQLDEASYNSLRNLVLNTGIIDTYYYITTGNYSGTEAVEAYPDAMMVAFYMGDKDLYNALCRCVGSRVASKSSSPALYMIYREENGRYVFYAGENLSVRLSVG